MNANRDTYRIVKQVSRYVYHEVNVSLQLYYAQSFIDGLWFLKNQIFSLFPHSKNECKLSRNL